MRYGHIPDDEDKRDISFKLSWLSPAKYMPLTFLPDDINLLPWFPPVQDQGQYGTCTAYTTTELLRYNMINNGEPDLPLSIAQLYQDSGLLEGNTSDVGRQIRDVIKTAANKGVVPLSAWGSENMLQPVSPTVYGLVVKAGEYAKVDISDAGILTALYVGRPFAFGVPVYKPFESGEVAETGIVPMPKWGETPVGQHAMPMARAERRANRLTSRNSWRADWGLQGNAVFQFEYIKKFATDPWTILTNA